MKNIFKVLGLITLTVVIGFSFVTCDDGEPTYVVYVKDFNWSSNHSYWGDLENGYFKGRAITETSFNWEMNNNFSANATKNVFTESQLYDYLIKTFGLSAEQAEQATENFINYPHYWLGVRNGTTLKIMIK